MFTRSSCMDAACGLYGFTKNEWTTLKRNYTNEVYAQVPDHEVSIPPKPALYSDRATST